MHLQIMVKVINGVATTKDIFNPEQDLRGKMTETLNMVFYFIVIASELLKDTKAIRSILGLGIARSLVSNLSLLTPNDTSQNIVAA
ncbi:hypothetical protein HDU91_001997, partial [Kappamyces sp. JEL0680]